MLRFSSGGRTGTSHRALSTLATVLARESASHAAKNAGEANNSKGTFIVLCGFYTTGLKSENIALFLKKALYCRRIVFKPLWAENSRNCRHKIVRGAIFLSGDVILHHIIIVRKGSLFVTGVLAKNFFEKKRSGCKITSHDGGWGGSTWSD